MLTANAMAESRAAALAAGADGFLSKPFDEADLLRLIHGILTNCQRQSAPEAPTRNTTPDAQDARTLFARLPQAEHDRLTRAALSLNREEIAAAIAAIADTSPALGEILRPLSSARGYQQLWEALGLEGSES
jgi:DNA-binding response OmpR family regulator